MKKIALREKLAQFEDTWSPHRIARVDDMQVLLAKVEGDFVWHSHENEDELFLVIEGTLEMHFRDKVEIVNAGEMIVVPKGVEHCPRTRDGEQVHLLLFERNSIKHTGDVIDPRSKTTYPDL